MIMKALNSVGPKLKSYRLVSAILFSFLALVIVMGAAQASGPMRPPPQPGWRMWWGGVCSCLPWQPTPKIHILEVAENEFVTFETEDFPDSEDFTVTMGYMYTRGVGGVEVGTFTSDEEASNVFTFDIPDDFEDVYQISIRAETDHTCPYFAYNWFYNNNSNTDTNT